MRNEIYEAAKFLSNLLRLHSKILTQEQLDKFQHAIEMHLATHYEDHWFPDKPNKGSAYRCIRINHKMDPIISKAGLQCGLDHAQLSTIFPNELTLWIDPSEVSYRIGENGSICVLFDGSSDPNKCSLDQTVNEKTPNVKNTGYNNSNKPRVNTNHNRASPTETGSLSSTTSTMSSPSPSSSPDQWCRPSVTAAPSIMLDQNQHNGQAMRRSPSAAYGQVTHNFHSTMGEMGFCGQSNSLNGGYSFTSNARNTNSHFMSGPSQSTWGSPSMRTDSPNGWGSHYSSRRHHQQYNGWDVSNHQQANGHHYGGIFADSNGRNGHHNGHGVVGGHHHNQPSHMSPNSHHNANMDHVTAYVSS